MCTEVSHARRLEGVGGFRCSSLCGPRVGWATWPAQCLTSKEFAKVSARIGCMRYSSFLAEQISHEFRNLSREILVSMFAIGPCKVPIPDAWLLHVHFVPEVCHCRLTAARSRAVLHDTLQSYIIAAAAA